MWDGGFGVAVKSGSAHGGEMPFPSALVPPKVRKPSRKRWILAVFGVLVICGGFFGNPQTWLNTTISAVESLGPWAPLVFALVYVAATVLLMPGLPLTLAAGALFGVVQGTIIVSVASTTAAALAFLIARYLAREAVAARTREIPAFAALDQAFGTDGWKLVGLVRLSPLFPFSLTNYAFGLTGVQFKHYVSASWAAMLPATVGYVYLGSLAGDGARSGEKSPLEWTLAVAGLVATLTATVMVTKAARKALQTNKPCAIAADFPPGG